MRASIHALPLVALLGWSSAACAPTPDPGGDGGDGAADAGGIRADGGAGERCDYTVNGVPGSDPDDCEASAGADVGDSSRTVIVVYVGQAGDPDFFTFSATVAGPLQATPYTMAGAVEAVGTLVRGDVSVGWRILKEPGTSDGDFTLTITDTGTPLGTGEGAVWTDVHGTIAATLSPVVASGATGTVSFTLGF